MTATAPANTCEAIRKDPFKTKIDDRQRLRGRLVRRRVHMLAASVRPRAYTGITGRCERAYQSTHLRASPCTQHVASRHMQQRAALSSGASRKALSSCPRVSGALTGSICMRRAMTCGWAMSTNASLPAKSATPARQTPHSHSGQSHTLRFYPPPDTPCPPARSTRAHARSFSSVFAGEWR
jgi:hypothetical protein